MRLFMGLMNIHGEFGVRFLESAWMREDIRLIESVQYRWYESYDIQFRFLVEAI